MRRHGIRLASIAFALAGGCAATSGAGGTPGPVPGTTDRASFVAQADVKFPDVLRAQVHAKGGDVYDFDVTVSSPYDTPQRYADAFRVTGADGVVYGERRLLHDHAGEQPFTRDLHGVKIPPGVRRVTVQARDQRHGYGGRSVDVLLPGR